jgi:hypothetical protein
MCVKLGNGRTLRLLYWNRYQSSSIAQCYSEMSKYESLRTLIPSPTPIHLEGKPRQSTGIQEQSPGRQVRRRKVTHLSRIPASQIPATKHHERCIPSRPEISQDRVMNQRTVLFAQKFLSTGKIFGYFLVVTSITNTVLIHGSWVLLARVHCGEPSSC